MLFQESSSIFARVANPAKIDLDPDPVEIHRIRYSRKKKLGPILNMQKKSYSNQTLVNMAIDV